ncbi:hypothetical protein DA075_16525 [Methylobacterium currus]|jgi:hypothetical protein|uniref:Uncharacterized protein n=1 Tax=Methylobacterium currus TaxID=2051553 RepID=A0A2R4WLB2_9HYPH|nr:hypothetical protein [Methylobacterium currus]AWB22327.1 hypothetical protein DA075_16525 [Methylobacterium currus]UHC18027.1 hypothetical protein LRS73_09370 [Methylobacterium currus]
MEQVVIVDPDEADAGTWSAILRAHRTQEFSDHVFVVEGDGPEIDALRALPGVRIPAQLDPVAAARLSAIEKLMIHAWSEREKASRTVRPGHGLNWGHKGFQNP